MFTRAKNRLSKILRATIPAAVISIFALSLASTLAAQQQGSLNASVRVTATAGEPEPARGITLYLLRKSFEDIRKEADAAEPALDMNAFIDKLEVSPALKVWMRKHQNG